MPGRSVHPVMLRYVVASLVLLAWQPLGLAQPAPEPPPVEAEPPAPDEPPAEVEASSDADAQAVSTAEAEADPSEGAPAEAATGRADDDIVVTGSRIRRTSFAQPSAVQVSDRKELQLSGANNISDVIKNLTINYGSDITPGLAGTSAGSSQFNLRGLGLGSTLVLLNGRRVVTAAVASTEGANFVDTNTLPMQAIERLEVLKGGGSAIYGSDAVAGVVNIITRKRMDGVEAQAGYQSTSDFKQHEWDISLLAGKQYQDTRLTALVTYFKREPLFASDRAALTGNDELHGGDWSGTPTPGLFDPVTAAGTPLPGGVRFRDPGCGVIPLSKPTEGATPGCLFNFNDYYHLVPNDQRFNIYTTFEHDLGEHAMLFAEAGYARSRASRIISPSLQLNQPVFVPPEHELNPTGERLRWTGRIRGAGYPPWTAVNNSDTFHTVVGFKGDFGFLKDTRIAEWQWEVAGTWSGTQFDALGRDTARSYLQAALNSCDPSAPNYDPGNCWNPFSFGPPNTESLYKRVSNETRTVSTNELTTLTLDFNGPLARLPGGDLSIALGSQIRRLVTDTNYDQLQNLGEGEFGGKLDDFGADRLIVAGYGELAIPIYRGIEVQAAGRVEQYDDVGSSGLNPMFGFTWTPATTFMGEEAPKVSQVRFRGTFARSFVAPSLLQTQGASNTSQQIVGASGTPNFVVVRTEGNPNLKPQSSTALTGGIEWRPVDGMMLGADYWNYKFKDIVAAESAQTVVNADAMVPDPNVLKSGGVVQAVTVTFINANEVTTDGIDVEFNYKTKLGEGAGTLSLGANASFVRTFRIPRREFSPSGRAIALGNKCTGQDVFNAWWAADLAAQAAMQPRPAAPSADNYTCDVAGQRNGITQFARAIPRIHATVPLSWALGQHTVSLIGRYISAYNDEFSPPGADQRSAPLPEIAAYLALDLQYSLRLEWAEKVATTIRLGVNNLLDAQPPSVNTNLGFDTETHDPRGRLIYGRLIQEF